MTRANYAHISLQVQDGVASMRADLTKVMEREKSRGVAVVTGTEANKAEHWRMIREVVRSFGFLCWRGSDMWVAIQQDRIDGEVDSEYHPVSPGVGGGFTAKGVLRVTYTDKWLGKVTHLVSHYKTIGQSKSDPETNKKIAALLGRLGREYGGGAAKVFYSGDQNEDDLHLDTFKGSPFTSCWDELKQYPNTHDTRTIDVWASYDPDGRVKLVAARTVPGLKLKGDHKLIEAEYDFTAPIPGDPTPPKEKPMPVQHPAPEPPYAGPPRHHGGPGNKPIHHIVIHSTVSPCKPGGARDIARYFRVTDRTASAHYTVDPQETIQAAYDSLICFAAPPNAHKIHIEMCDIPGPVPGDKPFSAAWKAARARWRWNRPEQKAMLKRTIRLTAELCLAYNVPPVFLSASALKAGKRGITTHANVSQAWRQTTHWDPGFWPRYYFMRQVRAEVKRLTVARSKR